MEFEKFKKKLEQGGLSEEDKYELLDVIADHKVQIADALKKMRAMVDEMKVQIQEVIDAVVFSDRSS